MIKKLLWIFGLWFTYKIFKKLWDDDEDNTRSRRLYSSYSYDISPTPRPTYEISSTYNISPRIPISPTLHSTLHDSRSIMRNVDNIYISRIERTRSYSELGYIRNLPDYMPLPIFPSYCTKGYKESDLQTICSTFREYLCTRSLNELNYTKVFSILLQLEDQFIINKCKEFNEKNIKINSLGKNNGFNEYSIQLNRKLEGNELEDTIEPYGDVYIKLKKRLDVSKEIRDESQKIRGTILNVDGKKKIITFRCGNRDAKLFDKVELADIDFLPSRLNIRYQYCALNSLSHFIFNNILFPKKSSISRPANISLKLYNNLIEENPEQLEAVMNIVNSSNNHVPYIILGPPGTGKTNTLVECVLQLIKSSRYNRILITSGSNAACNEIGVRLLKIIISKNFLDMKLLRICSASCKSMKETEPLLFNESNLVYDKHIYPSLRTLKKYKIIICTLSILGRYVNAELNSNYFSHVFIDECAASTEPAALVGISKIVSSNTRLILSGDTKQLGGVLKCETVKHLGLGKSLMERLLERDCYKIDKYGNYDQSIQTKLLRNYRTHEKIIYLSNFLYYNMELIPCVSEELANWVLGWNKLINKDCPIIFHSVEGTCRKDDGEQSFYNLEEQAIVVKYVLDMKRNGILNRIITEADIGIISPYKKQCNKILDKLKDNGLKSIETGSVEVFQGREKPIIIISMVKSFHSVGFLKDDKRINVMLSRPQALLIIIGNDSTLQAIPSFKTVIQYCKNNKCFFKENQLQKQRKKDSKLKYKNKRKNKIMNN